MNGVVRARLLGSLATVVALFGVAACAGTATSTTAGGHAAGNAAGSAFSLLQSPSPTPLPPTQVRELAMVTHWAGPDATWSLVYDRVTSGQFIQGCGGHALTPSDIDMHQREWQGSDKSTGAGETAMVVGAGDNTVGQATIGPLRWNGRGAVAVAAVNREMGSCGPYTVNGGQTSPVPTPWVSRPWRYGTTPVFCSKSSRSGSPTTFACFAALGVYDVYLTVYGFGKTVTDAADSLSAMFAAAVSNLDDVK